jgi:hypothetical protein
VHLAVDFLQILNSRLESLGENCPHERTRSYRLIRYGEGSDRAREVSPSLFDDYSLKVINADYDDHSMMLMNLGRHLMIPNL